jgi:ribosomal protein S12 methylthiotransferase accessory factor YcaO
MLRRLGEIGFTQVVAVDLTHQELGVPVIRVVMPGAETWSVFFAHGQRARLGARANQVLCDAICGTQSE